MKNGVGRHQWVHHHDIRQADEPRNRCYVTDEIELEVRIEGRIDCVRRDGEEERISIRCRPYGLLGANIAASAGPIVNDELLLQPL
jgi:hypothetical protein